MVESNNKMNSYIPWKIWDAVDVNLFLKNQVIKGKGCISLIVVVLLFFHLDSSFDKSLEHRNKSETEALCGY